MSMLSIYCEQRGGIMPFLRHWWMIWLCLVLLASGCTQNEKILSGERISIRSTLSESNSNNNPPPLVLPPVQVKNSWVERAWSKQNPLALHPAFTTSKTNDATVVWSTQVSDAEDRQFRITSDPVVAGGRIFTLGSGAEVMAHSLDHGKPLWAVDLTPFWESKKEVTGGGIVYNSGILYAATAFGDVHALNAETGQVLWTQKLNAMITAAPAVANNFVYVVTQNGTAYAINAQNGRLVWELSSVPVPLVTTTGASPVITDRFVILPFSSGEIVSALQKSGLRIWTVAIAGGRRSEAYANTPDLTGQPILYQNHLYGGSFSGRFAAFNVDNGQRLWTIAEGATNAAWPIDNSLFIITDRAELQRLDIKTGRLLWHVSLPYFQADKATEHKSVYTHYGPVLAGKHLIVASNDGKLRLYNPENGTLIRQITLPHGATTNPVVVNGRLYLILTNGFLYAFE